MAKKRLTYYENGGICMVHVSVLNADAVYSMMDDSVDNIQIKEIEKWKLGQVFFMCWWQSSVLL